MLCGKCQYDWQPRVMQPKECPRCKTRLDWQVSRAGSIQEE